MWILWPVNDEILLCLCPFPPCLCCFTLPPQVQWQGKGPEAATWLTRDDLVEMGLEKMVVDLDMKEAARAVSVVARCCTRYVSDRCRAQWNDTSQGGLLPAV